ncbi:MAG TPA: 3-methyl-2-oxobutanoate hydroxymethyltransferase [Thermoanaerobaculia bacterium]|jgi:3-methyl-2-oxobutanoate hydroxymethyltransferase|nr:3-methyl-2-oxobutanoate hydroxymethyltransferase [Thermoanaerobaculia bacterium]
MNQVFIVHRSSVIARTAPPVPTEEKMNEQRKRVTVPAVRAMKGKSRVGMLTAYDYPSGRIADAAGADIILVGDSLGMVVLGYPDTLSVTVDDMLHHTRAVVRGSKSSLIVGDMPYLSYHVSVEESVRNAGRFIQAGAHAVKIEGAKPSRIKVIESILDAEIPVMGHIGLTPQSVNALGGFKLQGKNADAARHLLDEAVALERAGCFSIVLECVPSELAAMITEHVAIPTIGIGAGPSCDGQVLVFHDVLGIYDGHTPKFVRQYAHIAQDMQAALEAYLADVRSGAFPDEEKESFHMASDEELKRLYASMDDGGVVVKIPR